MVYYLTMVLSVCTPWIIRSSLNLTSTKGKKNHV